MVRLHFNGRTFTTCGRPDDVAALDGAIHHGTTRRFLFVQATIFRLRRQILVAMPVFPGTMIGTLSVTVRAFMQAFVYTLTIEGFWTRGRHFFFSLCLPVSPALFVLRLPVNPGSLRGSEKQTVP